MEESGYYRFPCIHGQNVVFSSEEDLWMVSAGGGVARRLTAGLGNSMHPAISPDGKMLAFTGTEEGGAEVYVMPTEGGQPKRVSFVGAAAVVGWSPASGKIIYASASQQPFRQMVRLYEIGLEDREARLLPTGPANWISFGPNGAMVISRPSVDPAFWKRYRGGTAGDLWIDSDGDGKWRRLIKVQGNPSRPVWVGPRIYFISDHDGVGNLY